MQMQELGQEDLEMLKELAEAARFQGLGVLPVKTPKGPELVLCIIKHLQTEIQVYPVCHLAEIPDDMLPVDLYYDNILPLAMFLDQGQTH